MTLAVWFWILMVLWVIGYGWVYRAAPTPWPQAGIWIVPFLLILMLGWQVFGDPVK